MEEIAGSYQHCILMNRSTQVMKEEIWAKHYSSNHQILLVGEGDFSFALSLASSFRSGVNIVASSIDSYDVVVRKYKKAKRNVDRLSQLGAQLLYGVDARTMKLHIDLHMRKFDRIVYNFPHAGFLGKENNQGVIMLHRNLVCSFFKNASRMLRPDGEVHVSHKTKFPFNCWNIEQLASQSCLALLECVKFKIKDYPGYKNKRGDGSRSDAPFPLGKCCTFKFVLSTSKKSTTSHHLNHQELLQVPLQRANLQPNLHANPPPVIDTTAECFRIFAEYFDHARSTKGQPDCYLLGRVSDHLKFGFERYMAPDRGRRLDGYVNLLEELWSLSKRRIVFLENQLLETDHRRGL
ncbi:hypothetical protein OSB04_007666 [Centaurea solstitialis]|uniref:25S rRNA (uridine-N(3))-methyltransferase BMT5-like domain-containing protein n=1 Tax=Centaurea solstitialis TaxID=347529 RepID=A0AA38WTE6_9ASTR|nr:hypothetical protein OSB04_007666 [Centaurea solstitialis]